MNKPTEIQYYEVSIKRVLDYFVEGFRDSSNKVQRYEPFVETAKGKIILRLFVEKEKE